MTPHRREVLALVAEMEAELRRIGLWEIHPPPPAALMSEQPFCFDSLTFTQWLQWIFIARMRELIASDRPLPTDSDIHPLAEHVFAGLAYDSTALLELIARFDDLITRTGS